MLLSICIPTYNRHDKLKKTLIDILQAKSQDFEIFVLDNQSAYNINDAINIDDSRLKVKIRNDSVSGPKNCLDCLTYGTGRFVMLLLDKDLITGKQLDYFIFILNSYSYICGGYCLQNRYKSTKKINIIDKEEEKIKKFGYPCRHPSGYFFRKDCLNDVYQECNKGNIQVDNNAFIFDFFQTSISTKGDMMIYDAPLLYTETLEDAQRTKSYTYSSEKNNLYFVPNERLRYFDLFLSHLKTLDMQILIQKKLLHILYSRLLIDITIVYRDIMRNKAICKHNSIESYEVSCNEMLHLLLKAMSHFLSMNVLSISDEEKFLLIKTSFNDTLDKIIIVL
ncbi:glycosyltransferase [Pectinatus haikarae]|uniref:glycosyltransferase n=1 Tax=Pectinatus haikarae TaxID=349096 RepID=UPI0018C5C610|nr:glycosyltransferase [Pectinatus haikarae]